MDINILFEAEWCTHIHTHMRESITINFICKHSFVCLAFFHHFHKNKRKLVIHPKDSIPPKIHRTAHRTRITSNEFVISAGYGENKEKIKQKLILFALT